MSLVAVDERTKLYVNGAISACFDGTKHEVVTTTALEDELSNKNSLGFEKKCVGKVRAMYICKDVVIMVATDRQSAFDRHLLGFYLPIWLYYIIFIYLFIYLFFELHVV